MKIKRFTLTAVLWIGLLAAMWADTHYVATNGPGNGSSWAEATNSIQGAIDASTAGDTVLVSNGVYQTGGVTNYPSNPPSLLTNRVAISKAIIVRSANNDPANTIIKGRFHSGEPGAANTVTNGPAAVRPVYMVDNSSLIGFTLTNGATWTNAISEADRHGGGAYCVSTNAIISNCVITGNSADQAGAAYRGNLYNCTLSYNSATNYGGGTYRANLYVCMVRGNSAYGGGGAASVGPNIFDQCTFSGNSAVNFGGGGYGGIYYNCTILSNSATYQGGVQQPTAMYNCLIANNWVTKSDGGVGNMAASLLYNCTIVSNSASMSYWAGGVEDGNLINCIVYFNVGGDNRPNYKNGSFTNCCTFPLPTGSGNITNDPMFVNTNTANYRLSQNSPCINAGTNQDWMNSATDLDRHHRLDRFSGLPDMGCYEYVPPGTIYLFH